MLSIVIPTYKEAQNIDILLSRIYQTMCLQLKDFRIIIVDDNSQDGIEMVVDRHNKVCGNRIQLVVRPDKKGIASAWQEGIASSTTPFVCIMDADLAHAPEDVLRMFNHLRRESADVVIGSRYLPHHHVMMEGKSFLATYLSVVAQGISRAFLGIPIYDLSHSLRIFKREVFERVVPLLRCEGNAMMTEFTCFAYRLGFTIHETPVNYGKRLYGETKLSIWKEGSKFLRILFYLKKALPR